MEPSTRVSLSGADEPTALALTTSSDGYSLVAQISKLSSLLRNTEALIHRMDKAIHASM